MSLVSNLLIKIQNIAVEQNAKRVTCVEVWLGALAHISADHFREHFNIGVNDSIAANAELIINVSDDMEDPNAQEILLRSVEVE